MQRLLKVLVAAVSLLAVFAAGTDVAQAQPFPGDFELPGGFSPEGIAIDGRMAYSGSLADGSIRQIDLRTGAQEQFAPSPGPNKIAVGMDVDRFGRLWVAGGGSGFFPGIESGYRVYDTDTGALVVDDSVAAGFINDVIVTRSAAWFTDTFGSALIRVPIGRDGTIGIPEFVSLGGDWAQSPGPNANGIVATSNGKTLIVAQITTPDGSGAALYTVPADVDADAVEATRIELDGPLASADGMVLIGRTLYVVGPAPGVIKLKLKLNGMGATGRIVDEIEVAAASPTTADVFGNKLYVVDADFANLFNPAVTFHIVSVRR